MVELDELIGRRVTVRHRVPTTNGRELFTDAVGDLDAGPGPDQVRVHTRSGVVTVSRASVVAVRAIPAARPKRPALAAVVRLEEICADAWPPMIDTPLGQWRLRASGGFTGRANSALVLGDPGIPMADALATVREFAGRHGIAPRLQVPVDTPWHRAVVEHGWTLDTGHGAGCRVLVMVGSLSRLSASIEPDDVRLHIAEEPGADWWEVVGAAPANEGQRHVLRGATLDQVGFGLASAGASAVGAVRAVVLEDHLQVAQLMVLAHYRRRGLASALLGMVARWALERDARWGVLQVAEHNEAAITLYRRLGFRTHHHYEYLRPPATDVG